MHRCAVLVAHQLLLLRTDTAFTGPMKELGHLKSTEHNEINGDIKPHSMKQLMYDCWFID